MNEDELAGAMRASLPPRPETRTDAARRKARRRRIVAGAAGLLAVVALAAPFALQFGDDGANPPVVLATPSPTAATTSRLVPEACDIPDSLLDSFVADEVPGGVQKVWLCGGVEASSGHVMVGAPDPLLTHAREAVATFNQLEQSAGVFDCEPQPLKYRVVFEYPDGAVRAAQLGDCHDLRDATDTTDVFRGDGAGYLDALQDLWRAERSGSGFTFSGTTGLCDVARSSVHLPTDVDQLARVVACVDLPDGTRRSVTLPSGLQEEILESARTDASRWASEPLLVGGGAPALVLLTPEGDPVSALAHEVATGQDEVADAFIWWDGSGPITWLLPAEVRADIEDMLDAVLVGEETIMPEERLSGLAEPRPGWRWVSSGDVAAQVPQEWGYSDYLRPDWCVADPDGPTKPEKPYVAVSPGAVFAIACGGGDDPPHVRMHLAFGAPTDESTPTETVHRQLGAGGVSVVLEEGASAADRALAQEILATAVTFERDAVGCAPHGPFTGAGDRPAPWDITTASDVRAVGLCRYTEPPGGSESPNLEASRLLEGDEAVALVDAIGQAPEGLSGNPDECIAGLDERSGVVLRVWERTGVHDVYLRVDGCGDQGWDDGLTRRRLNPACRQVFAEAPIRWFGGSAVASENCSPALPDDEPS